MAHVSPISLHLHPLPKADITNWSLPSFTLSQDWSAESFSSQHSRKSLLRDQSWHTRWNLFIILFKILEHRSGTGSLIWSSHENYAFYLLRAYLFFVVVYLLSCVQLFAALWTVDHKASLSMGFPRQEYWSRLPFPPQRDFPNPGIEAVSPSLAGRFFTTEPPPAVTLYVSPQHERVS